MSSSNLHHSFAGQWTTRSNTAACRTIPFPESASTSYLALPEPQAKLAKQGRLCTLHVEDDCLEAVGIFPGDEIICKVINSSDEIDPYRVYIVKIIMTDELIAGRVKFIGDEWVSLECIDGSRLAVFSGDLEFKESLFVMRAADGRGHFDRDLSPFYNAKAWHKQRISSHLREVIREMKNDAGRSRQAVEDSGPHLEEQRKEKQ